MLVTWACEGNAMSDDCDDDSGVLEVASARRILETHPHPCVRRLAALAYLGESDHEL